MIRFNTTLRNLLGGKGKDKVQPIKDQEGPEWEQRNKSESKINSVITRIQSLSP